MTRTAITAIITATQTFMKNADEPNRVASAMSIPVICQAETTQHAAVSRSPPSARPPRPS